MTFSSVIFIFIFLPVTFGLYLICAKDSIRNVLLMLASLIFYAFGEPVAVFIMIISVIINYFLGLAASEEKHDKAAMFCAVLLNIGLLIAFKYTGFFCTAYKRCDRCRHTSAEDKAAYRNIFLYVSGAQLCYRRLQG